MVLRRPSARTACAGSRLPRLGRADGSDRKEPKAGSFLSPSEREVDLGSISLPPLGLVSAGGILVRPGNLEDPQVRGLLVVHAERSRKETAPGSAHALDLEAFRDPELRLFTAWDPETLVGVGAWRRLSANHGEVKAFHTIESARGRGIAGRILRAVVQSARDEGIERLSLETGSWPYFAPARAFYSSYGFEECGPFGDYVDDPNSVFMTRLI